MFPLVESWLKSGQTQKQFCATHQMLVYILAYWVDRYRKSNADNTTATKVVATESTTGKAVVATDSSSGFIRLSPPPTPVPTPEGSMEVVLPTGAILRFSATVPANYLKELLSLCLH